MNARSWLIAACFLLPMPFAAEAQGYAGLGSGAEGFAIPRPNTPLKFPEDHGPHPDFRIEWWYLTANLQSADGTKYGVQWTLFRSALAPGNEDGWQNPQIWMGHVAATSRDQHLFAERIARGGTGQAGVTAQPFSAWIDDWRMQAQSDGISKLNLTAQTFDFHYNLNLKAEGPLVLHGADGYSVKSDLGQASYYYSQPDYQVQGTLSLGNGPVKVSGSAWLDREWSSQPLAADQSGWDWFSLSLDSGDRLMGFVLRGENGNFSSGTWIGADGTVTALAPGAFQAEPLETTTVAGREIPTRWHLVLEERDLSVEVQALNPQSWMGTQFSYWEGPVEVSGSHSGQGYLEMTGYE